MNFVQVLFKNTVALAVSAVAYRIGLSAIEIVIARNFAPEVYGEFATALGFAVLFLVVIDLGVNLGLVRVIARGEAIAPTYFGNSLVIRLGLAVAIYFAMLMAAWLLYPPAIVVLVALLGVFVVLMSFQDLLAAVFQGKGEMEWIALFRIVQIGAVFIAVFATLMQGGSIRAIAWAHVAAGLATTLFAFAVTMQRFRPQIEWSSLLRVISDSYLYGLVAIFSALAFRLGVVILSFVATADEVGFFAAGQRIVDVLGKVPVLISMILIPLMFRAHGRESDKFEQLYRANIRVICLCALPFAAITLLLAPAVVDLLYGAIYAPAGQVLRILAIGLPFSYLSVALGDQLTARERQSRRTGIHGGALVVGLASHCLLAPRFGGVGSATAVVITEAVLFLSLLAALRFGVASLAPLKEIRRPLLSVVVASVMILPFISRLPLSWLLGLFATIYVAALLLTRAVRLDEIVRIGNRLLAQRMSGGSMLRPKVGSGRNRRR